MDAPQAHRRRPRRGGLPEAQGARAYCLGSGALPPCNTPASRGRTSPRARCSVDSPCLIAADAAHPSLPRELQPTLRCTAQLDSLFNSPARAHDAPAAPPWRGWPHSIQWLCGVSASPPISPAARTRPLPSHRCLYTQTHLPSRIPTLTLASPLTRSRRALRAPSPRTATRIVWACPRTTRTRALGVGVYGVRVLGV